MKGKIIEAGHYYQAFGPTKWARIGWELAGLIKQQEDKLMLFIDDVYSGDRRYPEEEGLPRISFAPRADYVVMESDLYQEAQTVLSTLKSLAKKKRARQSGKKWFTSGFPLTDDCGRPLCVLLDAGLTLLKQSLGFQQGINVLPFFYEQEQRDLLRLVRKAVPGFCLEVVLFDLKGNHWKLKED